MFLETDVIEQEREEDCFQQYLAPPFSVMRNEMPLTQDFLIRRLKAADQRCGLPQIHNPH